ncbi:MAG: hypothetical protein H0V49_09650 [Nocardioidaceae bacterium]|nr:hypothetical protein [Nocardioidaceae bacterium]
MTSQHVPPASQDPLFAALNPLVIDGTLSAAQADRVYRDLAANETPGVVNPSGTPAPDPIEQRQRIVAGLVVLGSALALVAATIAGMVSTDWSDFSVKSFAVGLVVTLALGGAFVASELLLKRSIRIRWAVSSLATMALTSLAVLILASWDEEALIYVTGLLLIAGGLVGYRWVGEQLLTLAIVAGGMLILGKIVSDFSDDSGEGTGQILTSGLIFVAFGAATVTLGWRFACRHLTAMVGSGIALTAMAYVTSISGIFALIPGVGSPIQPGIASFEPDGDAGSRLLADAMTDTRIAMFIGLFVSAAVIALYVVTGLARYAVLGVVGAFVIGAEGVALNSGDHPLRWAIGSGAAGLLMIAAGLAWVYTRRGRLERAEMDGTTPRYPHPGAAHTPGEQPTWYDERGQPYPGSGLSGPPYRASHSASVETEHLEIRRRE